MACHFARWTPASAVLDTQRLSDEVIAATRTFSVKRRTRYLQGRILLAEMMFYLYGLPTLPPSPPRRPAAPASPIISCPILASPTPATPWACCLATRAKSDWISK